MELQNDISEILDNFGVSVGGISVAKINLENLNKKWFLTFKKKKQKEFYLQILPVVEKLDKKFNEELKKTLTEQGKKFLDKNKTED